MKTIIALIALTVVTLGSTTTSYSQEQLDEVILSNKTTQVYVDDFSTFNKTISTLRTAVEKAKIGHSDRQLALKKLHEHAQKIEAFRWFWWINNHLNIYFK